MSSTTAQHAVKRAFNFNAGPSALPLSVLERVREELLDWHGTGMSVMEMSHRSPEFEGINAAAEAGLRKHLSIPDDYAVLFLQGGGSMQFTMVPMNLCLPGKPVDLLQTGAWTAKALGELKKGILHNVAATTEPQKFTRVPAQNEIKLSPESSYVHMCTNNTIEGTQWKSLPHVGEAPLVSDTSSDMFSSPIDVSRHALIYSGAQKNLGPSGVTLVIIREDLLARSADTLPTMLNYKVQAENDSLYNTPNTFGIYILGLTMKWLRSQGGLEGVAKMNQRKAGKLYAEIDRTGFYRGTAKNEDRSLMNVTFRLATEELEKTFVRESTAAGFDGLKGHRSVGGMRASIYNAFPEEGVDALVSFMREFERKHG